MRSTARPAPRGGVAGFSAGVRIVFGRELGAYFDASIAYVYAAVFLLLSSSIFMNGFFLESVVDMGAYFSMLPLLLALFLPAVTMRTWSEELAQGTFELITTLPFRSSQLVAGKYLAALVFYVSVLAGSLPIVAMLLWLGRPDLGLIAVAYLGAVLLGALFLALGIFVSGLTREQIVAFVVATFVSAALVLSGHPKVVEIVDGLAPGRRLGTWLYDSLSVVPHYESFTRGVVSAADSFYFVALSAAFLVMNALTLGRHR